MTSSSIKSYPQGVDKVAPKKETKLPKFTVNLNVCLTNITADSEDDAIERAFALVESLKTLVPGEYFLGVDFHSVSEF